MQQTYLEGLNKEQLEAVTLTSESALILAGAGSGKTKVLTSRISWLISNSLISPLGLIAVTFTNKAANEMLHRVNEQLAINTRGMWIGTFHGLCNRFLRTHYKEANLPQTFQILDSSDQMSAIKRLCKILQIDIDQFPPKEIQYHINAAKEEGIRANQVKTYDHHSQKINQIYEEYEKQCQREGVVDFGELLLRAYELLNKNEILRQHYQNRFEHILIDEFQDTSKLQYRWIKLLAGEKNKIFAVGDDDQSIYSFRGANIGNMKSLQKDFLIKKVIKLEQNYRSKNNILNAANAIIENNSSRLGKKLWTQAGAGELIKIYRGLSDIEETSYIIDEIKNLHRKGTPFSSIAILYRSNAQSRIIEHAIVSNNMPYRVYGGLRFFERAEIKHALAYLRLVANKQDDNAFLRIVNFPSRGIGNRTIEQIQDQSKISQSSLWESALSSYKPPQNEKGLSFFIDLIRKIEDEISGISLAEAIDIVINISGLKNHYLNEKDGADRVSNLEELVSAAVTFSSTHEIENKELELAEFLNYSSLESGELQAKVNQDALQLMTIHAAKGLEFNTVFITGLEEGLCPHEQSMIDPDGIEEERRLMYVAVTRARENLYLTHAQSRMLHGQTQYNISSRFLDEIPAELVKLINISNKKKLPPLNTGIKEVNNLFGSNSEYPFKIGSLVEHAKFGTGVVISYEGSSNDLRAQINFKENGIKWLALEFAKLQKI
ncbi:MAG: UvrD-helicase domain-containing protein [Nitrosomonadales bacterium]